MGKAACTFRKNDFKRLVQAAEAAGLEVGTIEVSKNGMKLTPKTKNSAKDEDEDGNEWDEIKAAS